jgi:hypothetical protein
MEGRTSLRRYPISPGLSPTAEKAAEFALDTGTGRPNYGTASDLDVAAFLNHEDFEVGILNDVQGGKYPGRPGSDNDDIIKRVT